MTWEIVPGDVVKLAQDFSVIVSITRASVPSYYKVFTLDPSCRVTWFLSHEEASWMMA